MTHDWNARKVPGEELRSSCDMFSYGKGEISVNRVFLAAMLTICLFISPPLQAQTTSTRLDGTVVDSHGNAIGGATVSVTDERTHWTTQVLTNSQGQYVFPALRANNYTISAKADGFKGLIRHDVMVYRPGSITEDIVLEPGDPSQAEEEVSLSVALPLTNAEISAAFTRRELDGLPLLNRDPLSLVVYQPGVQINGDNTGASTVNGARQNTNVVTMDGVSVSDPTNPLLGYSLTGINPDSIMDVRVVTDGASAEYGQNSGAHVMVQTRSGSDGWHGNVFDYAGPKILNSRDFFTNALSIAGLDLAPQYVRKSTLSDNVYGGTVSGPIRTNSTVLLVNYEGRKTDRLKLVNDLVLTPTAKSGIFQWHKPGTTDVESYDIPANDPARIGIDPKVESILASSPDPNNYTIGDQLNTGGYAFRTPAESSENQVSGRVDHTLKGTHRIFARFSWNRSNTTDAPAQYPDNPGGTRVVHGRGGVTGSDWTLNPRMVNEFRLGVQYASVNVNRPERDTSAMGNFQSWTAIANTEYPRSADYPIIEASDNFSFVRGNHTFKTGLMLRRTGLKSIDFSGVYGDVTFGLDHGNKPASSVGPAVNAIISPDDRVKFEYLYNDLLGRAEQVTQTFNADSQSYLPAGNARIRNYVYWNYAGFLQDDWRVSPNLTLSLGIRYELSSVPHESSGLGAAPNQVSQVSGTGQLSDLTLVPGQAWYNQDRNNFAPRMGFAWDISKKGTMVLRGSYGIFYEQLAGDVVSFVEQNTPAFSQQMTVYPNSSGGDVRLSNLRPPSSPKSPILQPSLTRTNTVAVLDNQLSSGRVSHFNLSLQREIFGGVVLEARYAGSRSNNLLMYLDLNQTKIEGGFLQAFNQIRSYRKFGTPIPASNPIVRVFGSGRDAIAGIGGDIIDSGLVGKAAEIMDREYYSKYAAAGVSEFYLRNYPQFNQFIYGTNAGKSWYDSVQLSATKTTDTYSASVHYVLSKSLDNISMAGSRFVSPADSFHPDLNKAPSDFDRPRVLSAMGTWRLPFGGQGLFGGWELGLMGVWEDGQRFSVSSGLETAQSGYVTLADYSKSRHIGAVNSTPNGVYWFSQDEIDSFTLPEAGTRGTSGRNSFIGPGFFELNASIGRSFHVKESKIVTVRAQSVNVLNHTNFGVPATDLSDATTFGKITTQVGSPRAIQVALKFQF
jgi:hypothetical protein